MAHAGWSPTAVRTVVALGVVTAAVIAAFVFVLGFHKYATEIPRIRSFLNANGEANLPAWWNATLLLAVAFCALVARIQEPGKARQRAWSLVALASLLMSMDEVTSLHERLGGPVRAAGITPATFAWLVPGVVIAAAGFLLLMWVGRALPPPTRGQLLLALICYGVGAIGVEAINGILRRAPVHYYWMGTTIEEALEMAACILAIGAIVNYLTAWPEAAPLTARRGVEGSEWPPDQSRQRGPGSTWVKISPTRTGSGRTSVRTATGTANTSDDDTPPRT